MLRFLTIFGMVCLYSGLAQSAPFIPAGDSVVLERLPFKVNDPVYRELSGLRGELSREPNNLKLAVTLAQRYFDLALAEGDPRFIGYAEAALAPWWTLPRSATAPPTEVLVLRATLRQYTHDFASALADLELAIGREPDNGAAWSLRAAIYLVQADYAAALQACERLRGSASPLIVVACKSTVDALTGKAAAAYAALQKIYAASTAAPVVEKRWALTRLAEIADRMGRAVDADAHFKTALALTQQSGGKDAYLLAAYAEFLLDANRPQEVLTLLKGAERSDVLLVRLALAEKALNLPSAATHQAAIAARFDAARLRGDKLHIQEESRFYLYFLQNAKEALRLAQENWQSQREPSDARMLLEAALAAQDKAATLPVLKWLQESGNEDVYLQRLKQQAEALR